MALISAQRIELVATKALEALSEFDINFYGITIEEFLWQAKKVKKKRKMLGEVFKLLKLNPLLVMDELDDYLKKRNILVHGYFMNYLQGYSQIQVKRAVDFCYDFGKLSEKVESFFKGLTYFLALRHIKDINKPEFTEFRKWDNDFEYFLEITLRRFNSSNK